MKHQVRISENAGSFMADRSWIRKAQKEAAMNVIDSVKNGDVLAGQLAEMEV